MNSTADLKPEAMMGESFSINGIHCLVTLTPEALKWQPVVGIDKEERVIPIEEILSVTLSAGEAKRPDDSVLKLVYMQHQEDQVLRRASVNLEGRADICTTWTRRIQECIDAVCGRPRSTLVVINPGSGDHEGPDLYNEKVAPVFLQASIKTHVIKSVDHVKELIRDYDLASIDSIITVGGDGTYHIVVDALLQRQMGEAGLDLNDPDTDIPEMCLPIGIIPCGSGNKFALQVFGTLDIESTALGIVRGGRQKRPLQGIWSRGEFVIAALGLSIGAMADCLFDAQAMRDRGKERYKIVFSRKSLQESARSLDVTIETRPSPLARDSYTAKDIKEGLLSVSTSTKTHCQPWTTSFQGRTPNICAWVSDFIGMKESEDMANLDITRLFVLKKWDGSLFIKHMHEFFRYDSAILHTDETQHIPCVEYKITINNPTEQDGRANMFSIDGEIYFSKEPKIHVNLVHPFGIARRNLTASKTNPN